MEGWPHETVSPGTLCQRDEPAQDEEWLCAEELGWIWDGDGHEDGLEQSLFQLPAEARPAREVNLKADRAHRALLSDPGIDMTTALSLCKTNSDASTPSSESIVCLEDHQPGYAYGEGLPVATANAELFEPAEPRVLTRVPETLIGELGRLLPKELRDKVVVLYFRHVHPLCPVVDEYEFAKIYRECRRERDLFLRFDVMLFMAMMFVGFAHVEKSELAKSSVSTILEGQNALLGHVKSLYNNSFTSTNPTTLTCVCVLLSYWSPFNLDTQVNSRWVARAFLHARQARLEDPDYDSGTMFSRRKIIWWCCVLRDRLVSVGLRRLHRLHKVESRWGPVTTMDFGAEAVLPQFMGAESKRIMMAAFIWMCDLTQLINDIGTFHVDRKFQREWRDVSSSGDSDHDLLLDEMLQCSAYESRLKEWKVRFKQDMAGAMARESVDMSKVPLRMPQLVNLSLFAALYRPYLKVIQPESRFGTQFRTLAAAKVKEASAKVVKTVYKIFSESRVEHVPLAITAWIALPLAVCELDWHATGGKSSCLSVNQRSDIMISLNALAERLCGVQPTYRLLSWVSSLISNQGQHSPSRATKRARSAGPDVRIPHAKPVASPGEEEDSEILDLVAGAVDLSLSSDEKM
ncbi:uncharacterized protein PV07_03903 [Cladophialophora immunda]|uniref:Xylanolytic transcriptional activator regulatory domain-containing protein n=1 Tax=Cladophialophora immunda TaxID=569365 RepID=A0A0D2CQS5_9EURO|nr:uncharacterized protein PV07_03903 [Cladophialophora immunda]KIW32350.1 hypothetical protein PV07_03903 [Cladophialophora immunda]